MHAFKSGLKKITHLYSFHVELVMWRRRLAPAARQPPGDRQGSTDKCVSALGRFVGLPDIMVPHYIKSAALSCMPEIHNKWVLIQ